MKASRYRLIAVLGSVALFFALWQTAIADPPEKPGNPGVPGLLAEIAELKAQIADLKAIIQGYQNFAPVPQTGQTEFFASGDDGDLEKGVLWPDPRFTDNDDGTVTDNLTGLVWLKDANCFGAETWADALFDSNNLKDGGCQLTDGSEVGDWRLPSAKELGSLLDYGTYNPSVPMVHPFDGLVAGRYWSSTTYKLYTPDAWFVNFYFGYTNHDSKNIEFYVWPVRDVK